ncbi:tautomerase family protein [Microbacterium karelineae]|uniref:tautomerase family protein n=1 Tax=Microbacterium karelineae TaxID=2654283 RepID=UPI0012EABBD0|nr:tautomerase family protein [Microbacterium karelineae]
MPYFKISTPIGAYTDEDKQAIAKAITDACTLYVQIPAFFVNVYFDEIAPNNTYTGGESRDNFVRIMADTSARQMPTAEMRAGAMSVLVEAMRPFIQDRGYHSEINLDETPLDLWRVDGIVAPVDSPEIFDRWIKENRAVPWEVPQTA